MMDGFCSGRGVFLSAWIRQGWDSGRYVMGVGWKDDRLVRSLGWIEG